jgi:arylsulfatase A-like enzyme
MFTKLHFASSSCILFAAFAASCSSKPAPAHEGLSLPEELVGTNVLITLIDAAAIDHIGAYGFEKDTMPFLSKMAAEGLLFQDVTSPAPYTLASVASLMTGEAVDVHGVTEAGELIDESIPMLAERFQAKGYATDGLSANSHIQERFGFDRGFDSFRGFWPKLDPDHAVPPAQLKAATSFLQSREGASQPFFAYWHFLPPHAPYSPPLDFKNPFSAGMDSAPGSLANLMPLSHGSRTPSTSESEQIESLYNGSLFYIDSVLAQIHAELVATNQLDKTLWIVVSDHGEAFGQHGLWQHARTVYEEMVRVPVIMRFPEGAHSARRGPVMTPVGLSDLHATLVDLYDLGTREARPPWSSASLAPLLQTTSEDSLETLGDRPPIITRTAGPGEHVAIRRGELKLIHILTPPRNGQAVSGPGTWEFYDLSVDPGELHPLPPEGEAFVELRRMLTSFRREARARERTNKRVEIDAETSENLGAIGYGD